MNETICACCETDIDRFSPWEPATAISNGAVEAVCWNCAVELTDEALAEKGIKIYWER